MDKFQHKLKTTLHTRSVQNIMLRTHAFFNKGREHKTSQPKIDNITTYLRKFEIDRENLNLAKRIMQCESEHNRDNYVKQWKKTKKFLKVRSNFKPQLTAYEPKIFKLEEIPGHGRLLVRVQFECIESNMKLINSNCLYLLKFSIGGSQLIPNKEFLTLQNSGGYKCVFYAPHFVKDKLITVRLIKVIENNLYEAGKFGVDLAMEQEQTSNIIGKSGKNYGFAIFHVKVESTQRKKQIDSSYLEEIKQNNNI